MAANPRLLIRARDLTINENDKPLGSGGFGVVYKGLWKGRPVAVKIMNVDKLRADASRGTGEDVDDEDLMAGAMEDILAEAQEMQHLRHPNIVEFLGVCTHRKYGLVIVTELCEGGSLEQYLAKNRPLKPDVRDKFVREICEGLQYLHDNGIMHRDLKPGNLLLGQGLTIKISDFGMTRSIQRTTTVAGGGGTPNYMSPESLKDELEKLSEKDDIWALGGILAELFGGRPPFEGKVHVQIITAVVVQGKIPDIPSSLPQHTKEAIKSCFAFNPVDRPAAKEVLAKLGISSDAAPNGLSVSPAGVSPISPTSGVHTSMATTTTGLPSTVSPAQIKPVVQTASPGQPDASVKSPPDAPQPQTKPADTGLRIDNEALPTKIKRRNIFSAVLAGDVTSVAQLIKLHEPSILDEEEVKCFCCKERRIAAVNQLLAWDPKLIDARGRGGKTPFMKAALYGHVDVMKVLYAKGGERLLTETNNNGFTPLHLAAGGVHSAAVSQLLEWGGGALLDIKGNDRETPWDWAKGRTEIRKIMEKYKR
ncbi:unnamed protein product [Vitrella brassicaformis CCMP3155]|uniref:Protein kinase domain-containing protein n=1 Tax=Vitrella brassicaformis (strain CCMP3155) TaxID=1169540 RepID=A0A0G4G8C8_VITBC|nr:unnamed protein product [Vitrella brassicaformis CCMP3155]|eukprot:CEM24782.1 unnamed protein product [Vitrella brassicaformis CCMP3155]